MFKKALTLFLFIYILFGNKNLAYATSDFVSSSATLSFQSQKYNVETDLRVTKLKKFLESYNSPLSKYAFHFVKAADAYNLDYRLLPAITGVESTFGKRIPYQSYNAYGWANGKYIFSSWEESIYHVSKALKEKYYNKGANNIDKISRKYAPPSKTWGAKVKYFMDKIEDIPAEFDL